MNNILHFIGTLVIFILGDILWLGLFAKGIYQKFAGHLMRENVNWVAAILFYLFFICGILFFVVYPALKANSPKHALLYGAFFGFITYMTYELTNMAIIKNWQWAIVPIDIAWGAVLCAGVGIGSFYLAKMFNVA